jgi:hypothetical protein
MAIHFGVTIILIKFKAFLTHVLPALVNRLPPFFVLYLPSSRYKTYGSGEIGVGEREALGDALLETISLPLAPKSTPESKYKILVQSSDMLFIYLSRQ